MRTQQPRNNSMFLRKFIFFIFLLTNQNSFQVIGQRLELGQYQEEPLYFKKLLLPYLLQDASPIRDSKSEICALHLDTEVCYT